MPRGSIPALLDAVVFARSYQQVERALLAFSTLLLPSSCVACGAWDTSLCPTCLAAFRKATVRPFRAEDGAESLPDVLLPDRTGTPMGRRDHPPDEECPRGRDQAGPPYGPLPVIAAGRYSGAVPAVLLAFKNHGHVDLTAPVAAALAGALHTAVSEFPVPGSSGMGIGIVPVPTRAASRRKRGYDPLGLLLTTLRRTGSLPAGTVLLPAVHQVPLLPRVLSALVDGTWAARRSDLRSILLPRLSGGQKGLGRRSRRTQVGFSMQAARYGRRFADGTPCIIVDDVLTTGATIGEVHRVLTEGGARVLGAVVVAATAPPTGGGGSVPAPGPLREASSTPAAQRGTSGETNFRRGEDE